MNTMLVIKRNGSTEEVKFDKIKTRIQKQTWDLDPNWVDPIKVAQIVITQGLKPNVTTRELDIFAAETAASMSVNHPDYSTLASRIAITALHKETDKSFSKTIKTLYNFINPETNLHTPLVSKELCDLVQKNKDLIDSTIIQDRDFNFDYFGFKTLEKSYLLRVDNKVVERPQYLWMRVSLGIWGEDFENAFKTYEYMSQHFMTHATPTLFNAGTNRPQLSSCFLVSMKDDSIEGIFDTLKDVALISKNAGGIGLAVSNLRAKNSFIAGTGGYSNGLAPFLRIFNATARAVDQCFVPQSEVITSEGIKEIQNIKKGDKVLTSDNNLNEVNNVKSYEYEGELVNFTVNGNLVSVTPEHPILAIYNTENHDLETLKERLVSKWIVPEWVDAKNLTKKYVILKY